MTDKSIMLDLTKEKAESVLCQAMIDETLRLRECLSRRERDSIRSFLKEAYLAIAERDRENENLNTSQEDMHK